MILLDLHIHIYLQYGMMLLASMPLLSSNTLLYHLTMELVLFSVDGQIPTRLYLWDSLPRNAMGKVGT
jgi:hypothetical protein